MNKYVNFGLLIVILISIIVQVSVTDGDNGDFVSGKATPYP